MRRPSSIVLNERIDICRRRVLYSRPSLLQRAESSLPVPKISNVRTVDGDGNVESVKPQTLTARVPRYLVESTEHLHQPSLPDAVQDFGVKLIGFGERFVPGKLPATKFNFNFQAPEFVLLSQLSPKADIWSLGCLVRFVDSSVYRSKIISDASSRSTS